VDQNRADGNAAFSQTFFCFVNRCLHKWISHMEIITGSTIYVRSKEQRNPKLLRIRIEMRTQTGNVESQKPNGSITRAAQHAHLGGN
jgi:hypothetical protein